MMIIRKASKKDLPAILKLIGEHPEQLMQSHLPKASEFLLAIQGKRIVGCCALEIYSKRLAEIRSLAVNKDFQGRGIATKLIKSCLKLAKKKKVYEVISITSASRLFEKHGFGTFNNEKYALIKILQN
ncbi:MAG: GNAT family N-acetyltransferase [Patescibacteria group bacterium]